MTTSSKQTSSVWQRFRNWFTKPAPRSARRSSVRPTLDFLEDRTVPSLSPISNEFQVAAGQVALFRSVATAADGHFAVVWASNNVTPGTLSPGLLAEVFNGDGTPRTGAITIVTPYTQPTQLYAPWSVAMDAAGDFIVTWQDTGIMARRFDASGTALGDAFMVAPGAFPGSVYAPAVAMDAAGDFVVVYTLTMPNHPEFHTINAAWFDSSGTAGAVTLVDTANSTEANSDVAMDPNGNFVVTWAHDPSHILARGFAAGGQAFTTQGFQVNQAGFNESNPHVAMNGQDNFVLTWTGNESATSAMARRYDAGGMPLGNAFTVAGQNGIAMDGLGNFVITWSGLNGGDFAIFGQEYDATGQPAGPSTVINDSTTGNRYSPSVAMDPSGGVAFAWNSFPINGGGAFVDVRRFSVHPAGFTYDATTGTLDITGPAGSTFTMTQATGFDGRGVLHTTYTFTLNGSSDTFVDAALAQVNVSAAGTGNSATVFTNNTYFGMDGLVHETSEIVSLGNGAGDLYKYNPAGQAVVFLHMTGFDNASAVLGRADSGQLLPTPGAVNTFVSAGSYSYMTSAGAFYVISGAAYVYGYASGPMDLAYHYDGSGPSTLTLSGTTYSSMYGTDGGLSFYNCAMGFTFNYGYAQHAGDTAIFYDSPANDFYAGGTGLTLGSTALSYLFYYTPDGKNLAEYDAAWGFAQNYAYSFVGGTDIATVWDPAHNHVTGFTMLP